MIPNQSESKPKLSSDPPARKATTPRILVVDDDDSLRQLNTEALQLSGYQVDAAEDGAAAWETLQFNNYDLLITDQRMPRVCGIELLKKVRAARMAVPVIMATGTSPQAEFARHPGLQPSAVLLKPYTIPELLQVVRAVLYAADYPSEQINALLTWRSQSSPGSLRL
jgi:DNA-binding response OmpR family regulator